MKELKHKKYMQQCCLQCHPDRSLIKKKVVTVHKAPGRLHASGFMAVEQFKFDIRLNPFKLRLLVLGIRLVSNLRGLERLQLTSVTIKVLVMLFSMVFIYGVSVAMHLLELAFDGWAGGSSGCSGL